MDGEYSEGRVIRGMGGIGDEFHPPIILEIHSRERRRAVGKGLDSHPCILAGLSSRWGNQRRDEAEYDHYLAVPGKLRKEIYG